VTAAGWLSGEDCPDCDGPLLETSTGPRFLILECPGCGYRTVWHITDDGPDPDDSTNPDHPGESRGEMEAE
jgi:uncharacterized Zn finger protein (UPF0148 family)